jgi:Malectin domain
MSTQYHTRANARIFDVFVEGLLVINDLDLMSIPGGNISYVVAINSFVTDGNVTIDFVRVKDNPQINGIEVYDNGQPIPLPTAVPQTITEPTLSPFSSNSSMTLATSPVNATSNATTFEDIVINCGGTYAYSSYWYILSSLNFLSMPSHI